MKLVNLRPTKLASAFAVMVLVLTPLLSYRVNSSLAAQTSDIVWVLIAPPLVNPSGAETEFYGGGSTPGYYTDGRYEGKHTIFTCNETSFAIDDRHVDHGNEAHWVNIQTLFEPPPTMLVPDVSVPLDAWFSHGGAVNWGAPPYVEFGYATGNGPVWVEPNLPFAYSPWHPDFDGTDTTTFTLVTGQAESGIEFEITAYWRAVAACEVTWKYRAVPRTEAERIATQTADTGGDDTDDTGEGDTGDTGEGDTGDTGEGDTGDTGEGDTGDAGDGDTGDTGEGDTGDAGDGDTGEGDTGDTVGDPRIPVVQGAICGVYPGVSIPPDSPEERPWDTAAGQDCCERWIREAMGRLNAYDGDDGFNSHKPWSISEYGTFEGKGVTAVAAPDNFGNYDNNRCWWMWDEYNVDSVWAWRYANWRGAQVPPIRQFVYACLGESGGAAPTVTGASSTPGTFTGSTVPGNDFPPPPYGDYPEPARVGGMALQAGQRRVPQGALVPVPVYLINGANVANMNFNIAYNNAVARPEGDLVQGSILGQALFEYNNAETNLIRVGFAQKSGIYDTGAVTYVPFRAVGQPGTRTDLCLEVTTINDPDGNVLPIDRIHGFIKIVNEDGSDPEGNDDDGVLQGDCTLDGYLDERDATCALRMSVNLLRPQPWMDMDGDGDVTSRDATIILQRANVSRARP